jgi:2,4-dienoyl-CoA reductase-like NADH-dependent reductase (Old Yellow Enzyme family)
LWVQLDHPGRQCPQMVCTPPLSPSDVQLAILGNFARPRPMDQGHIEEVIARIIITDRLVKKAGFSGVKINGGGALKNRVRIIVGVRKALGTDFPIGVKLNSTDFQKVSFNLENCITVARWLGEDSVDFLEISGGTYKQLILIGVEPTELR